MKPINTLYIGVARTGASCYEHFFLIADQGLGPLIRVSSASGTLEELSTHGKIVEVTIWDPEKGRSYNHLNRGQLKIQELHGNLEAEIRKLLFN